MMRYIHQHDDLRLVGWCGDVPENLGLAAFADADFASDNDTSRSTNCGILFMTGPDTRFPVRQSEAEVSFSQHLRGRDCCHGSRASHHAAPFSH
eukprot:15093469-Alexandrium_andersonii.AAC.1